MGTLTDGLEFADRVTTTDAVVPVTSNGTWKLTCSTPFWFAIARMGAAIPFTAIETSRRLAGNGTTLPETTPGSSKTPAAKTVASDPGVSPGAKLAAFTTPAEVRRGARLPTM